MAVQRYVGDLLVGTNAERTGGTWTGIPTGWRFVETDTKRVYVADGSGAWNEQVVSASVLTGQIGVAAGGTGAATLTGLLLGNGTSAVTTMTAPSGTVAGTSDSQIFTNKTMDAATNNFSNIALSPTAQKGKFGTYYGTGTTTGFGGIWQGNATAIAIGGSAGTSGLTRTAGTGMGTKFTTGTTINNLTGIRINVSAVLTERDLNPVTEWYVQMSQTTAQRMIMGYTSSTAAPTSLADPLASLSGVAFWHDTAVDNNWHIMQNNGGASSDSATIANVAAIDTSLHTFAIRAVNASAKFQYAYNYTPGQISSATWTDISTAIPAATTALGWIWYMEDTTAAAKLYTMYWAETRQDG